MARRTYAEFDSELQLRLSNRTDITQAMRQHFLNDALRQVSDEFEHPELQAVALETLVKDTAMFTPIATDIDFPTLMWSVTQKRPVDYKSKEELETKDRTAKGPVTEYSWWNNKFFFDRTVDKDNVLRIWYKRLVPEITAGPPAIRERFDMAVIIRAAKLGYEAVGNLEQAHIQDTLFNNYMSEVKIPADEARKNDRRQGFRVRFR
jgi:hypothetical protein